MERCGWCLGNDLYLRYHDEEWGVPVHDDRRHFEFLVLEGVQAGLSWLTVLRKREAYLRLYDGFDPAVVAAYGEEKIGQLLADASIVRNAAKIRSSINNAQRFLDVQREFGSFDRFLWGFVDGKPVVNSWTELSQIPASTPLSDVVSKELKRRGFTFVGSTIIYSHLQAVGLVNDHITTCFRHAELAQNL